MSTAIRSLSISMVLLTLASNVRADLAKAADVAITPATSSTASEITSTSVSQAMKMHNERISILMSERDRIAAQRAQAQAIGDKAAFERSSADLEALDREIVLVSKEPVHPIRFASPVKTDAKLVPAAQVVAPEAQQKPRASTYESWDVFKNFAQKGPS